MVEPWPTGKQPSPEGRIAQLEKALGEARRECLRQQALVRAAQRSLGIKLPSPMAGSKAPGKDAGGRKKRRPAVRALKAARTLAQATRPSQAESLQQEDPENRPAVSAPEGSDASPGGLSIASEGAEG